MHRDPYVVLDIARDATFDEAKGAYRRLATIFHPDRFTDARPDIRTEAEKQMRYLNQAWQTVRGRLHGPDESDDELGREPTTDGARDRFDRGTHETTSQRPGDPGGDFGSRARHARTREKARTRGKQPSPARARMDTEAEVRDQFVQDARERLAAEQAQEADAERQAFVRAARERLRTEQEQSA